MTRSEMAARRISITRAIRADATRTFTSIAEEFEVTCACVSNIAKNAGLKRVYSKRTIPVAGHLYPEEKVIFDRECEALGVKPSHLVRAILVDALQDIQERKDAV